MFLQLKVKIQSLKATLETASQHHSKEKQKYFQLGDSCQKLREKSDAKVNKRDMHPKIKGASFNKINCV